MALAGKALVVVWNDIAPEMREDFFEWHPREHMVERLGIPGFIRGRRCRTDDPDTVEFLTLYEIADADVLASDLYKERLTHPTPWSTRTLPAFRNNVRGACRIHVSEGHAMGGVVATVRLRAAEGREGALVDALKRESMPGLTSVPRITGAHLVENDVALTGGNAGNQRGRMISLPHIVVLLEGSTVEGVRAVCAARFGPDRMRELGATAETITGIYRLEYSIQNLAPGADG